LWFGDIQNVRMLGANEPLKWNRDQQGLHVERPQVRPGDHAYVLKVS
jgi:alpha-L-fucosidase